jgi:carbon monoxide dehydrogenase subunit G
MTINDTVLVDAPLDDVWQALIDVPRVATCIPGAAVDEVVSTTQYRCSVKVTVGPVSVAYRALLTVREIDDVAHRAILVIDGTESRGRGGVQALVTADAAAEGDAQTRLRMQVEANVTGIVATIGGRLIEGVAKKTTAQFARNLSASIRASSAPESL